MTTYRRAPGVFERRSLSSLVLLAPDSADVLVLEGTGPAVWAALEQPRTLDELSTALAATFGASPAVVQADLQPVLEQLVAGGMLLA